MIYSILDPGLWPLAYDYVALQEERNRWNYPSLAAPYWRVYWHDAKGAVVRFGKRAVSFRPEYLYLIPPNLDCSSSLRANCRQLYVHFQIRRPYALRGPPIIVLPLTEFRRCFVQRIIACYGGKGAAQWQIALLIRAFLETLIADLTGQYLIFRKIDKRLLNALNYLEQHLEGQLDNRKLAELTHVTPRTLMRLFKIEIGKAPQAYLRQLRVDRACWLLRFSDETIKQIAEATGFYDRYHFTRIFKALTGHSPARYRASN